jgi:hypothetical protein
MHVAQFQLARNEDNKQTWHAKFLQLAGREIPGQRREVQSLIPTQHEINKTQ